MKNQCTSILKILLYNIVFIIIKSEKKFNLIVLAENHATFPLL